MAYLNYNGKAAFGTAITFIVIASVATGLRLRTRRIIKKSYEADDWWILIALICFYVFVAVMLWGVFSAGGGQNLPSPITNYLALQTYLLALFVEGPFYLTAVTCVRYSLTCLYRRIFVTPSFRQLSIGTDCFTTAWFIMAILVAIFSCKPVDYLWNPLEKGFCFKHYNQYYLTREIVGTLLDAVILLLPIRTIMTLQMSRRTKLTVSGIFLLGGFVVVTNAVRVALIYRLTGEYVSFAQSEIWSNIHLGTAILCSCLPTYRPLFPSLSSFMRTLRRHYVSLVRPSRSDEGTNVPNEGSHTSRSRYAEIMEGCSDSTKNLANAKGPDGKVDNFEERGYPLDSIEVSHTIDIV